MPTPLPAPERGRAQRARGERPTPSPRGTIVRHPHDAGLYLGSLPALSRLPSEVSAVVSLCRFGTHDIPAGIESVQVWLVDEPDRNPNLDLVLTEAADMIATLRAEGKTVFLHCAEGRSRTSAVATLYAARHRGIRLSQAWSDLRGALPEFAPQRFLRESVARIAQSRVCPIEAH